MIESIIDMKPTWPLSCRQTWPARDVRGSGSRRLREQARRLQLFAAQADHHGLAAEVRVLADVAQGADRDVGAGRLDGDAAAVGVLEADDVVDVRVQGSSSSLMRLTAKSTTPETHCTVVVMARMLRVPTEPSALR
jgi:hypothetical protein